MMQQMFVICLGVTISTFLYVTCDRVCTHDGKIQKPKKEKLFPNQGQNTRNRVGQNEKLLFGSVLSLFKCLNVFKRERGQVLGVGSRLCFMGLLH